MSVIDDGRAAAQIRIFENNQELDCKLEMVQTRPGNSEEEWTWWSWGVIALALIGLVFICRFYKRKYTTEILRRKLAESAYNEAVMEAKRKKAEAAEMELESETKYQKFEES